VPGLRQPKLVWSIDIIVTAKIIAVNT